MIYTYHNFKSIFLQMNTWWYIHTATLDKLSYRCTGDDIYIPQLYINFPSDEHLMIDTYRNFLSTLLQMNTGWYIDTVTLYELSCTGTSDNIYIPQLYMNFPWDEQVVIYTYWKFFSTADEHVLFYSCWNFISFFVRWTRDDRFFSAAWYQLSCR